MWTVSGAYQCSFSNTLKPVILDLSLLTWTTECCQNSYNFLPVGKTHQAGPNKKPGFNPPKNQKGHLVFSRISNRTDAIVEYLTAGLTQCANGLLKRDER